MSTRGSKLIVCLVFRPATLVKKNISIFKLIIPMGVASVTVLERRRDVAVLIFTGLRLVIGIVTYF